MAQVSAAHESHPSTTFAATESVFEFLDAAARGNPNALEGFAEACRAPKKQKVL